MVRVGDTIPSVELTESNPLTKINLNDTCKGRKVILFGVLGAFAPGCSTAHLSGFISRSAELKRKGYQEIICVTVNDIFVTTAWGKDQGTDGKVRLLADPDGEFIKALDLQSHIPNMGIVRSKYFTMVIVDNVVKQLFVEPDAVGVACTSPEKMILE